MQYRMKLGVAVILFLFVTSFVAACSKSQETIQFQADPEMKAMLRVMYPAGEEWFRKDYGDLFNAKYPNIEITVIPSPQGGIDESWWESEKPDVLALDLPVYEQLIADDKLYDLNTVITNDAFHLDGMHSGIIDFIRQRGGGKLYGLPPTFYNKAIYYNKELFDRFNIPYPKDQMTWEEILELAKRFPADEGIHGLYIRDYEFLVSELASSRNLSAYNTAKLQMTINTEAYKDVFETVLDAYKSGAVVSPSAGSQQYDPFINKTSAMAYDYSYYINNEINWAKEDLGSQFQLDWELASAPSDSANRELSSTYFFTDILTVSADSDQKQAAWELVKFMNSEELAKVKSKTAGLSLQTRTDYNYNPEGKRIEAFYNQKPNLDRSTIDYTKVPKGFSLRNIINQEVASLIAGVKSVDEVMASIEQRGQAELSKGQEKK